MKKLFALIFTAALLLVSLAGCADSAAYIPENPASDFEYEVNEDNTVSITKYIGESTILRIPICKY